MILVTLGTQDRPFTRLLDAVDEAAASGAINPAEDIICQAGHTPYRSDRLQIFSLLPRDEYERMFAKASLLITHGGAGSMIAGMKRGIPVFAMPRLAKYGEHQNDHQIELVEKFGEMGYVTPVHGPDDMIRALGICDTLTGSARRYENDSSGIIARICAFIEKGKE
jgi:UDP-N-acetylglucosamine transferase subunit ALG13